MERINGILKTNNNEGGVDNQLCKFNENRLHFANFVLNLKSNSRFYAVTVGLFAIGLFAFSGCNNSNTEDLGTYDDPKVALIETQKIFAKLSNNVNKGYESVYYVNQYEIARDKIFNID